MEQRLEGRILDVETRDCSIERYDGTGRLIALGEMGPIMYVRIKTPNGEKTIQYNGSLPREAIGHHVVVDIEEIPTFRRARDRCDVETDCQPAAPTRTKIYDSDAQKWYS